MMLMRQKRPITCLVILFALAFLLCVGLVMLFTFQMPRPLPATVVATLFVKATALPTHQGQQTHLPIVVGSGFSPLATPPISPLSPPATPTPSPIDFDAARASLQAQGQELAFVKIGFHVGPGGNQTGIEDYLVALAAAGVPAFVKCVDDYSLCARALRDNPDNITVFRLSGGELELPEYDLPAQAAGEQHWARILAALPPEFDRRTWLEVMNEPYKEHADWLGQFAFYTAQLALRDGYRFAAFGWSAGEPELEQWEAEGMLQFLTLASQHPAQLGVALHEYSYNAQDIADQYPYLMGRFQWLFQACDQNGLARPTVLITEWGWESEAVPPVEQAIKDIAWASRLYAAYPQVQGAALWYLGGGYGDIAEQAQQLVAPLHWYAVRNYFGIEPGQRPIDPNVFKR